MKHLKWVYLLVRYEDYTGMHEEIADVIAHDFTEALRKYQMNLLPYGAQLRYAKERM